MRNSRANKVKEGGGGGTPGTSAGISLQLMERTIVQQIFTVQLVEDPTLEQLDIS